MRDQTEAEYTPAQRRTVDREIARGLADITAGRTYGPFKTSEDLLSSLHTEAKKLGAGKIRKRKK